MSSDTQTLLRYDTKSIWLHWLTAALVISLWCVGETIDWFPRGTARTFVRSLHILAGATLGMLFLHRIWWRSTAGARLPAAATGLTQMLATTVHLALYAAVIATLLLGVANTWVRGDTLFNLISIPAFDPGNKVLRENVGELHGLAANVVLILVALHAAAALQHHYLWKDQVLRRMSPLGKPVK